MRAETPVRGGGIFVFGVVASLVAFAALTAGVSLTPPRECDRDPELSTIAPFHRECEPIHAASRVPWEECTLSLSNETWTPALNPCDVMPVSGHIPGVQKRRRTRGLFGWLKRRRSRDTDQVIPDPPAPEVISKNSGLRFGIRF
jgi:hypothetical protein